MQDPAPKYVQVPQDSPEWKRVQTNLRHSLPGAELKGLKRVQNRHVWERFYRKSMSRHNAGGVHMNMVHPGSAIRELWHASTVTNATCESTIGCDSRMMGSVFCLLVTPPLSSAFVHYHALVCVAQVRRSASLQGFSDEIIKRFFC